MTTIRPLPITIDTDPDVAIDAAVQLHDATLLLYGRGLLDRDTAADHLSTLYHELRQARPTHLLQPVIASLCADAVLLRFGGDPDMMAPYVAGLRGLC